MPLFRRRPTPAPQTPPVTEQAAMAALAAKNATKEGQARNAAANAEKAAMLAKQLPTPQTPASSMDDDSTLKQLNAQKAAMDRSINSMQATPAQVAMQASGARFSPNRPSAGFNRNSMGTNPMGMNPMGGDAGAAGGFKKGGKVKAKKASGYSSGGSTTKASKRGDGIAQRGKTKGRMI